MEAENPVGHPRRRQAIVVLVVAAAASLVMTQAALAGKSTSSKGGTKVTTTATPSPSMTAASASPSPSASTTASPVASAQPTSGAVQTTADASPSATASPEPASVVESAVAESTTTVSGTVDPLAARAADAVVQADKLLVRPVLTAPTTITMSSGTSYVSMDPTRDYIIKIKTGTVFPRPLTLTGGRNVVFEDAVMQYAPPLGADPDWLVRGLYLVDQTGVMWVSNLQIRGPLSEGIDLSQKKGASVVLRNITVDPVYGSQTGHHADVLQTWAGPGRLVVDGLTGTSNFQGVFLQPADTWDGPDPDFIVLRNINLDMSQGIYALSSYAHGAYPIVATDITVKYNPVRPSRDQWLWPKPSTGDTTWANVVGIGPV